MITPPTAPSPGKPVSAGFFARLIGWVKSMMLLDGPGYRVRRSPNGTTIDFNFKKETLSNAEDNSRFSIEKIEQDVSEEDQRTFTISFKNTFYRIGGRTYELHPGFRSISCSGSCIIALVVGASTTYPSASLKCYEDLESLQVEEKDYAKCISPLYRLGEGNCSIECDFRIGPDFYMGEFASWE